MKAIEFGEERLSDIEGLARELWQDERDPRSSAYVRVLERPPVHWGRVFAWTVLPFVFTAALLGLAYSLGLSEKACLVFGAVLLALYGLACLKRGIIGAIRIYQRYAPACLRNKCRFSAKEGPRYLTCEPHLTLFAGREALDREEARLDGRFLYPDPKAAYRAAVDALKEILLKTHFAEEKGEPGVWTR